MDSFEEIKIWVKNQSWSYKICHLITTKEHEILLSELSNVENITSQINHPSDYLESQRLSHRMTSFQFLLNDFHAQIKWLWIEWKSKHKSSVLYFLTQPIKVKRDLLKRKKYTNQLYSITHFQEFTRVPKPFKCSSPFLHKYSPMVMAISSGNISAAKILLDYGALVGEYEICVSIRHGDLSMFRTLYPHFQSKASKLRNERKEIIFKTNHLLTTSNQEVSGDTLVVLNRKSRHEHTFQEEISGDTLFEFNSNDCHYKRSAILQKEFQSLKNTLLLIKDYKLNESEKQMLEQVMKCKFLNRSLLEYCFCWSRLSILEYILPNIKFPQYPESNNILLTVLVYSHEKISKMLLEMYPELAHQILNVKDQKVSLLNYALMTKKLVIALNLLKKYNVEILESNDICLYQCTQIMMSTRFKLSTRSPYLHLKSWLLDEADLKLSYELLTELIKRNANILPLHDGKTLLHILTAKTVLDRETNDVWRLYSIRKLIDAGITLNTRYNGETALHRCVENDYYEAAKILISAGACPLVLDDYGSSAIALIRPGSVATKLVNDSRFYELLSGAIRVPKLRHLCLMNLRNTRKLPKAWMMARY
jgi:hypothetical protein